MRRRSIIVLFVWLAGCTPALDRADSNPVSEGTEAVALTIDPRSEWRALWIEGATDLPDGALLNYRVTHELAQSTPMEDWPTPTLITSGRTTVQSGAYWAQVNTLNWPAGSVEIVVRFPLPPQPDFVVERFGAFGEHLTGSNVQVLNDTKVVELAHTLDHRP